MEFYSLKHRRTVAVPKKDLRKRRIERLTAAGKPQVRYAVVAVTKIDGETVKLSKFVNRTSFEALKVPEVT